MIKVERHKSKLGHHLLRHAPPAGQVVRGRVFHPHVIEPGAEQHPPRLIARRQQVVLDRRARAAVNGVYLRPAQVVQDEQAAAGREHPRQFVQSERLIGKVGKAVVADDHVERARPLVKW